MSGLLMFLLSLLRLASNDTDWLLTLITNSLSLVNEADEFTKPDLASVTELEKATDKFSSNKILGKGGFGRVYYGVMEDGIEVAVKLLTREDQSGDREFIAEVEMLSRCLLEKM
ncbi:hypothetical protein C4D60_Mb04t23900 [Musa balbisiana]|uniref:Protein kinase domain-containing protein n=1 Tax=Musa balbisiana TaxID=52838 RepID=A0A4S8KE74_MUSBA|nr:hypothetical protein C4D60_Mb04t23900 [Musa balbisiana]